MALNETPGIISSAYIWFDRIKWTFFIDMFLFGFLTFFALVHDRYYGTSTPKKYAMSDGMLWDK